MFDHVKKEDTLRTTEEETKELYQATGQIVIEDNDDNIKMYIKPKGLHCVGKHHQRSK